MLGGKRRGLAAAGQADPLGNVRDYTDFRVFAGVARE